MDTQHNDFLIAEYKQSWDLILDIDSRRGKFAMYCNALFIVVLISSLLVLAYDITATIAFCLTVIYGFTFMAITTVKGVLESERSSNIRYRKKINLIREVLLGQSHDPAIKEYLNHPELGNKLFSDDSDQPTGDGRTLMGIYRIITIQRISLITFTAALWAYHLTLQGVFCNA